MSTGLLLGGVVGWLRRPRSLLSLAAIGSGVALMQTAITRVCPVSAALGIDTTEAPRGGNGFQRMRTDADEPSRQFPAEEARWEASHR